MLSMDLFAVDLLSVMVTSLERPKNENNKDNSRLKISNTDLNTYISLGYKVRRLYISDLIILLLHYTPKSF